MTRAAPAAPCPAAWFDTAAPRSAALWRGVEAQHVVSTMRLVDTLAEQDLLERILEASKPAPPPAAAAGHYLLSTPFRYRAPVASRFRAAGAAGVWYGAETLATAAAEVAYWRWRFVVASEGLRERELLTEHSFFRARVDGVAIDLAEPPFSRRRRHWTADRDYTATQALAQQARVHGVQWIRYESVRQPGGRCGAVFDPATLTLPEPQAQQTWHCKATASRVRMVHDTERHEWVFGPPPAA